MVKKTLWLLCIVPLFVKAQTVEVAPVDIIYGNRVIHGQHQVVLSSANDVDVIPVQKTKPKLAPDFVVSVPGQGLSYLEEGAAAAREQAIFDEVNKRTRDAPFTVLFTGTIPKDIEAKRLRMMPKIDLFGDQSKGTKEKITPDTGEFSAISPSGEKLSPSDQDKNKPATQDGKLK